MHRPDAHAGTLFGLTGRLVPQSEGPKQTIPLFSRTEYEAIPGRWQFFCFGALFRLRAKHWSQAAGVGTATLERW